MKELVEKHKGVKVILLKQITDMTSYPYPKRRRSTMIKNDSSRWRLLVLQALETILSVQDHISGRNGSGTARRGRTVTSLFNRISLDDTEWNLLQNEVKKQFERLSDAKFCSKQLSPRRWVYWQKHSSWLHIYWSNILKEFFPRNRSRDEWTIVYDSTIEMPVKKPSRKNRVLISSAKT